jgi:type I restriction enzyme, S subunit
VSWRSTRLKYVTSFAYGDALPVDNSGDGKFPVYGSNGPFTRFHETNTKSPVIVIGRKGSYGKINWSSEPCFASDTTFFVDESTTKNNLRWLYYLLQSLELDRGSDETAVPGLNRDNAYEKYVLVPTVYEQQVLANYLDRETVHIDALIAEKENLLELLAEKRRALITNAVTRGFNQNVKLKDSGVEWLGMIPEHWEVKRLKYVLHFLDHKRIPLSSEERGSMIERVYDYYGASGIIDKVEDYIFDEPLILVAEDGANLYSRSTPLAFLATGKYWVNNHAHILRPMKGSIDYFVNLLESIDYAPLITGSAQPKLTIDNLANIQIPSPPAKEQKEIAEVIMNRTVMINNLVKSTQTTIDLLRERRSSLIAAAVTGKINFKG